MRTSPQRSHDRIPTFDELAKLPDEAIDVALGAALVAKDVIDDLDVRALLRELDALAAPLGASGLAALPLAGQVEAVSERFRELGFRGNAEDYYDPKNSLLPDVIERRLGIPITLAVVWCELARRAGVLARGVAFPGHFLVRVDDARGSDEPVIVDPFAGGRVVGERDAQDLLRRALGEGPELHPSLLAPASPRAILVRMLGNLKAIWAGRGEHARAFVAIDRILTLTPDSPRMLRERAGAALRVGATELARADLARVVELEPEAPDVPLLQRRIRQLEARANAKTTLN